MSRQLWVVNCGRTTYQQIADLHARAHARCVGGEIPEALLLAELEPVYTAGHGERGELVPVERTRRAGGVTYMGPGQLVGVPLLAVVDARVYVRRLEAALAGALSDVGVRASGREGTAGLWVGSNKIASLGMYIDRGFPREGGFAVHVAGDLTPFERINPCGESPAVTSIAREAGEQAVEGFGRRVAARIAGTFEAEAVEKQVQGLIA